MDSGYKEYTERDRCMTQEASWTRASAGFETVCEIDCSELQCESRRIFRACRPVLSARSVGKLRGQVRGQAGACILQHLMCGGASWAYDSGDVAETKISTWKMGEELPCRYVVDPSCWTRGVGGFGLRRIPAEKHLVQFHERMQCKNDQRLSARCSHRLDRPHHPHRPHHSAVPTHTVPSIPPLS